MTSHYTGLNRDNGGTVTDEAHISQSVTDILTTPKGSRLMRRDYGSDIPALLDGSMNDALRLRVIAAIYESLTTWEPRITVSRVTVQPVEGAMTAVITGYTLTGNPISITTPLSRAKS
jgi:phage baseplate assembly protein W